MDLSAEAIEHIRAMAVASDIPKEAQGKKFVMVPNGFTWQEIPPPEPPLKSFIEQGVTFDDKDSFVRYVNLFKTPDSRIFHDDTSFVAVLDYHAAGKDGGAGAASRTKHIARYALKHSPEWSAWIGIAGNRQPQREFAEFLEEHAKDIIADPDRGTPDQATLLEVAQNLQISRAVNFVSGTSNRDGTVQFSYVEEDTTTGGKKGNISVPAKITVAVPVYKGDPLDTIEILFRHRLDGGKLFFLLKILDVQTIKDRALKAISDGISVDTGITPFWGRAN